MFGGHSREFIQDQKLTRAELHLRWQEDWAVTCAYVFMTQPSVWKEDLGKYVSFLQQ